MDQNHLSYRLTIRQYGARVHLTALWLCCYKTPYPPNTNGSCTVNVGLTFRQYQTRTITHPTRQHILPHSNEPFSCVSEMELAIGLEPTTHCLQSNCSTDWAMPANSVYALALTQTLIEYAFTGMGKIYRYGKRSRNRTDTVNAWFHNLCQRILRP